MFKKVEVLKTGTFPDSMGVEHTFTESDLGEIAKSYDPARHEAPVVIGHPKENAPAFGWVKRAFTEGKSLFLELKDLVPEFVDACKRGLYKKRSIALYPDRTIRHIGFLGAVPPAIKGLADIQFTNNDGAVEIELNFNEPEGNSMELKEALEKIDALTKENSGLKAQTVEFSEKSKDSEKRIAELTASNSSLTAEVGGLKKKIGDQETASRKAGHANFCETLIKEGRLLPKNKEAIIKQLEIAHQASTGNFSEGQVKPIDELKKMLQESPRIIEFGEDPNHPEKPLQGTAGEKLDQLARKKMVDNKDMSFSEACRAVQIENRGLAVEYAEESTPK